MTDRGLNLRFAVCGIRAKVKVAYGMTLRTMQDSFKLTVGCRMKKGKSHVTDDTRTATLTSRDCAEGGAGGGSFSPPAFLQE